MNNDENMSGKKLCKLLYFKIFTSDILNTVINVLIPIIISIWCIFYNKYSFWWKVTILICFLIIFFNILSLIANIIQNRTHKILNLVYKCYDEQRSITENFTSNIYSLNKKIQDYIQDGQPIPQKTFDRIADFQTFSFSICTSIHGLLSKEYGKNIECEVTLMQKENNIIKMIAYSNNEHSQPSSYSTKFTIDQNSIYFVKLFNDLNGEISCLHNKESVNENFQKLEGSKTREDKICQYIGIPIKTYRNEIELLLQIDVSKKNIFGKKKEQMKIFAKNVLYPYAVLLNSAFERDLIFSQYCDMIVNNLRNKK